MKYINVISYLTFTVTGKKNLTRVTKLRKTRIIMTDGKPLTRKQADQAIMIELSQYTGTKIVTKNPVHAFATTQAIRKAHEKSETSGTDIIVYVTSKRSMEAMEWKKKYQANKQNKKTLQTGTKSRQKTQKGNSKKRYNKPQARKATRSAYKKSPKQKTY